MPLATCRIQGSTLSASRMLVRELVLPGVIQGRTIVLQCKAHIYERPVMESPECTHTGNELSSITCNFLEGNLKKNGNFSEIY